MKDLYEILGVSKSAGQDEIKKSYRKLAKKFHPDVNKDKPDAEKRFKEISAAYEALGDPEKRKLYDEFGFEGLRPGFDPEIARQYRHAYTGGGAGPGGVRVNVGGDGDPFTGFGFSDWIEELFGGGLGGFRSGRGRPRGGGRGTAAPRPMPRKGQDIEVKLSLNLEQAVRGDEVRVTINKPVTCSTCNGTGAKGEKKTTCGHCGGTGRAQFGGFAGMEAACPYCNGTGQVPAEMCPTCRGQGAVMKNQALDIKVPAGVDEGSTIRLKGQGAPGKNGGPQGDLFAQINISGSSVFERDGDDLTVTVPLTVSEAILGGKVSVPTPTGNVTMTVPPNTQSGTRLRLGGKGVKGKGDLFAQIEIRIPEKADEETKELARKLALKYSADHSNG